MAFYPIVAPLAAEMGGAVIDATRDNIPPASQDAPRHISFLRIVNAADADFITEAAAPWFAHARCDFVEIMLDDPSAPALSRAVERLIEADFQVCGCNDHNQLVSIEMTGGNYAGSGTSIAALQSRFVPVVFGQTDYSFDIGTILATYDIAPRGMIQLGPHHGTEVVPMLKLGIPSMVLVEANPDIAAKLAQKLTPVSDRVTVVAAAATDHDGPVRFSLTTSDQSSSLLKLGKHQELYPKIREERHIIIPGLKVDTILAERELDPASFNILMADIQGAELMALRGAESLLPHLDVIIAEVNFAELYEGCPQIEDIDRFLGDRGFTRVALTAPFHPHWGDAVYVRRP